MPATGSWQIVGRSTGFAGFSARSLPPFHRPPGQMWPQCARKAPSVPDEVYVMSASVVTVPKCTGGGVIILRACLGRRTSATVCCRPQSFTAADPSPSQQQPATHLVGLAVNGSRALLVQSRQLAGADLLRYPATRFSIVAPSWASWADSRVHMRGCARCSVAARAEPLKLP